MLQLWNGDDTVKLGKHLRTELDWADVVVDNRAHEESTTELPRELVASGTPPTHDRPGLPGIFRLKERPDFELAVSAVGEDQGSPLSTISYHLLHRYDSRSSVVMLWEHLDGWRSAYAFTPSMVPRDRTPEQFVLELVDSASDSPLDWLARASIAATSAGGVVGSHGIETADSASAHLSFGEVRALIVGAATLRRAVLDPGGWFGDVPSRYGSMPSQELVEWAASGIDSAEKAMELRDSDWTPGLVMEARAAGFDFKPDDGWGWLIEAGFGEWAHDYADFFDDLFAMKQAGWSEAAMRELHRKPRPPLPADVQSFLPHDTPAGTYTEQTSKVAAMAVSGLPEPLRAWFQAWELVAGGPRAASFWIGAGYRIEDALALIQSGRAPDFSVLDQS